ncbi:unnamed protein product [Urochloa decumbens]|uniref:Uncharacterized protein n=1 Tax=Urochloa decumbens TaxID=240449 RepID=A0ABC8Y3B9_9POAL
MGMGRWLNGPFAKVKRRRHLYLVLDDWSRGYSIRKFDLSSCSEDPDQELTHAGAALEGGPICTGSHHLPTPFFRFEAGRSQPWHIAGAFDSKILDMQPMISNYGGGNGVVMYDVRKRSLMLGPRQRPDPMKPIYVMVDDRLFALADGSFEWLYPPPSDADGQEGFRWAWHELPELPFRSEHVTCYAVHRDEQTIFVSIGGSCGDPATLSFDTAESVIKDDDCKWKHHGQWQMPFTGRAYYVPHLEAWVGLSSDPDTTGHLCSCEVVPASNSDDDASQQQCQGLKLLKEKMFSEVPEEKHIGTTLVHMGEDKFCFLECIYIQADKTAADGEKNENSVDEMTENKDHRERFIRLTTFSLVYDMDGDLSTFSSRRLQYYSVPQEVTEPMLEFPVAFWM